MISCLAITSTATSDHRSVAMSSFMLNGNMLYLRMTFITLPHLTSVWDWWDRVVCNEEGQKAESVECDELMSSITYRRALLSPRRHPKRSHIHHLRGTWWTSRFINDGTESSESNTKSVSNNSTNCSCCWCCCTYCCPAKRRYSSKIDRKDQRWSFRKHPTITPVSMEDWRWFRCQQFLIIWIPRECHRSELTSKVFSCTAREQRRLSVLKKLTVVR